MDAQIFLGGSETGTLKDLSAVLGKETIDYFNIQDTRGMNPSVSTNYQKAAHDLMSMDELAVMDGGKCIVQVRGVRPFFSKKYDVTNKNGKQYKVTIRTQGFTRESFENGGFDRIAEKLKKG